MGIQINGNTDTVSSTTSGGSVTLPSATLPAVSNISATRVSVTGVSTFTTGPVLIGSGTSTGTASQSLQVTGGAYVSGNIGVGITNPQYNLEIAGSENVTTQISLWGKTIGQPQTLVEPGRIYATAAGLGPGDLLLQPTGGNLGIGTASPTKKLHVQTSFVSGEARGGGFTQTLFESNNAGTSYWEFQANSSSANDILFSKSSTGSYGIVGYDHSTDSLRFFANAAERARLDSSGNFKLSTAGTKILNSSGNPILQQTGSILQVVHTQKTNSFSGTSTQTGSGFYIDVTGLSATITPTSTNSKILILTNMYIGKTTAGGGGYQQHFRIKRNGTAIILGDGEGGRPTSTGRINTYSTDTTSGQYQMTMFSGVHYDSPASTSALTYQIALGGYTASPVVYVNRSETWQNSANDYDSTPVSTLTLMEVSA
jgi:hypothetical protein